MQLKHPQKRSMEDCIVVSGTVSVAPALNLICGCVRQSYHLRQNQGKTQKWLEGLRSVFRLPLIATELVWKLTAHKTPHSKYCGKRSLRNRVLKYHSWSTILVSWHSRRGKSLNVLSRASCQQSPQGWSSVQLEPGFLSGQWCSCWIQKGPETFPASSWIHRLCMQWMHKHQ